MLTLLVLAPARIDCQASALQLATQAAAQSRAQASITGTLVQQYADDLVKNQTAACVAHQLSAPLRLRRADTHRGAGATRRH